MRGAGAGGAQVAGATGCKMAAAAVPARAAEAAAGRGCRSPSRSPRRRPGSPGEAGRRGWPPPAPPKAALEVLGDGVAAAGAVAGVDFSWGSPAVAGGPWGTRSGRLAVLAMKVALRDVRPLTLLGP